MLTMDMLFGTLVPQAEPMLTIGTGALIAMVAFLALALAAALGTARELESPATRDVRSVRPTRTLAPQLAA